MSDLILRLPGGSSCSKFRVGMLHQVVPSLAVRRIPSCAMGNPMSRTFLITVVVSRFAMWTPKNVLIILNLCFDKRWFSLFHCMYSFLSRVLSFPLSHGRQSTCESPVHGYDKQAYEHCSSPIKCSILSSNSRRPVKASIHQAFPLVFS